VLDRLLPLVYDELRRRVGHAGPRRVYERAPPKPGRAPVLRYTAPLPKARGHRLLKISKTRLRLRRISLVGMAWRAPLTATKVLRPRWVNVPTNLRCPAHLQHLPGDFAASPWCKHTSP
jgi:hypothetical protein